MGGTWGDIWGEGKGTFCCLRIGSPNVDPGIRLTKILLKGKFYCGLSFEIPLYEGTQRSFSS